MVHNLVFRVALGVLSVVLFVNHHIIHRPPAQKPPASSHVSRSLEFCMGSAALLWTLALVLYVCGVLRNDGALRSRCGFAGLA